MTRSRWASSGWCSWPDRGRSADAAEARRSGHERSSLPAAYLGIGEVLAQLSAEFPDVSVSKIRFLETEGLIEPARSPSGYRRFAAADVERLRYILTAQRDQYLPLRVIKEQLDAAGRTAPRSWPTAPRPPRGLRGAAPCSAGGSCWRRPAWTRSGWPSWRTSAWSGGAGGSTARTRWRCPAPWPR